jgi:hypothetical protein
MQANEEVLMTGEIPFIEHVNGKNFGILTVIILVF